jgi:hypothetical protein
MRSGPDSGSVQVTVAAATALVLLAAAFLGAGAVILGACQAQPPASHAAVAIPAAYLAPYRKAGAQYGIPWTVLAGIGEAESDHGRSDAPAVHSGANAAGTAGPMQFGIGGAAGNTWGGAPIHPASEHTGGYGTDGDHNRIVDVYDPRVISRPASLAGDDGPRGDRAEDGPAPDHPVLDSGSLDRLKWPAGHAGDSRAPLPRVMPPTVLEACHVRRCESAGAAVGGAA